MGWKSKKTAVDKLLDTATKTTYTAGQKTARGFLKVVILGLDKAISNMRKKAAKTIKDTSVQVVVGYTAPYALAVHEDLNTPHPRGKKAKFLEEPARKLQIQKGEMIKIYKGPFGERILNIGLRLQKSSQAMVPVDTGLLKLSAFTRLERLI